MLDWPVRPTLVEYERRLKAVLRAQHATEVQIWATLAPHQKKPGKPPKPHPLIRD